MLKYTLKKEVWVEVKKMEIKVKFSKMFYIAYTALFLLTVFIGYSMYRILVVEYIPNQGVIASDLSVLFYGGSLCLITYVYSLFSIMTQMSLIKSPVILKDDGVHNVNIGGIFLAFIFIARIKFIPWDHIYFNGFKFRVKKEFYSEYNFFHRFILRIKGVNLFFMYSQMPDEFYARFREDVDDDSI